MHQPGRAQSEASVFSHRLQPVVSDALHVPVGAGFSRASRPKDSSMPQHVFHGICPQVVSHTKNEESLEKAARDKLSGLKDEKPPGVDENG